MKAKTVTIGASEISRRVAEEYEKKKGQVYEQVIKDVLPQYMAVCMVELNKNYGFGEKRLRRFLDGVNGMFSVMDGVGILNREISPLNCLEYLKNEYGIDVDKELER